ncbi:hypothetical protein PoB_002346600 [Plakobranchus ocellatus]|uniref:Uncharacterized protein n=1 Tax=Plakobranchus ocellatus TaxID=259542 RepID=A0AAV3ZLX4_9GAST|nr:hypothetical protein PoB_002346600 [Plakobranchus ocellatus]
MLDVTFSSPMTKASKLFYQLCWVRSSSELKWKRSYVFSVSSPRRNSLVLSGPQLNVQPRSLHNPPPSGIQSNCRSDQGIVQICYRWNLEGRREILPERVTVLGPGKEQVGQCQAKSLSELSWVVPQGRACCRSGQVGHESSFETVECDYL